MVGRWIIQFPKELLLFFVCAETASYPDNYIGTFLAIKSIFFEQNVELYSFLFNLTYLRVCSWLRSAMPCLLIINEKAIQYNTIQYNTIQYNTIQYNTILYNTIQYNTIKYYTTQYNTKQNKTIQYYTVQ